VAKTAVGRGSCASSQAAASRAGRRPCGLRRIHSGSIGAPAADSAGVEAEQVRLLVAQEGDPAVPERQQVLGRHPAAVRVVDRDRRQRRMGAVEQHDRHVLRREAAHLRVGGCERDRQHAVDPAAHRDRAEELTALLGALHVEQDQVVAGTGERAGDAAQALDHRRRGEEGRDDADRVRAAGREGARDRVGPVVERRDRVEHPPPSVLADRGRPVQHP
jgi:hypothetical protein